MPKHTIAEEEIVLQVQRAQSDVQRRFFFNKLVHQYQEMAYQYAYSILGDVHLAQDATQESFLTAYQLLCQLREPQAFSAWLQRILYTQCCRLLKQEKSLTQSLELSEDFVVEQPSLQTTLETLELQNSIRAMIESLPQSQQTPVSLYYLEHYSQIEIANLLRLSLSAVKKRLERARTQLKERMHGMAQEYLHSTPQESGVTVGLFTTLMQSAAAEGQYVLLETLLVEGMDVDEQDANGQTLLHWAAKDGNLEAVELLLVYRADTTHRDKSGRTPLQLAVEGRHSEVAKSLRQRSSQE